MHSGADDQDQKKTGLVTASFVPQQRFAAATLTKGVLYQLSYIVPFTPTSTFLSS
jgi:hypothetical protein